MVYDYRHGVTDEAKLREILAENSRLKADAVSLVAGELKELLSGDAKTILQLWYNNRKLAGELNAND